MNDLSNKQPEKTAPSSPRWSSTTKMIIGFTYIAILAGLLIRFRSILGPLLISIVLAYLLYPLANFLYRKVKISWRLSATIIFLLLLVIVLGLLTLGGLAVVEQGQSLVKFLQTQIVNLPTVIANLSDEPIDLGFFQLDLRTFDLTSVANQLLGLVQPILSNTANILGAIAAGAATTIGWLLFSILVGYFIVSESGGVRMRLINLQIPGYSADMARMGVALSRTWNAFLRGQIILFAMTVIIYVILLGGLRVNYYFGLALLAGLARFVPYVGPWVTWITYGLVSYFQAHTIFGMEPLTYVIVVVGIAWLVDTIMDNMVVPRIMGDALQVHPAAVMIAAIISASLFGLIGVLLAAPVLATLKLVFNYTLRKMFDQDPWEGFEDEVYNKRPKPLPKPIRTLWKKVKPGLVKLWMDIRKRLGGVWTQLRSRWINITASKQPKK